MSAGNWIALIGTACAVLGMVASVMYMVANVRVGLDNMKTSMDNVIQEVRGLRALVEKGADGLSDLNKRLSRLEGRLRMYTDSDITPND